MRSTAPIGYDPDRELWTLTRYADCRAVLQDSAFSAAHAQGRRSRRDALPVSMVNTDPPEHTRLRTPFSGVLARADLRGPLTDIEGFAGELAAECLGGPEPAELIAGFARPVTTRAFAAILGFSLADTAELGEIVADASINLDPLAPPELHARGQAAALRLREYLRGEVSGRRRRPREDLLTALVRAADAAGLSDAELLSACSLLVIGGHDPTLHLVGNAALALLRHRSELERLVLDPSLLPGAIEEFLRFDSPIQLAARAAVRDVVISGATIRRGAAVLVLLGAANRDPQAIADPDRVDVARRPNRHLAFGAGSHRCLGARVLRLVAAAVLRPLVPHLPDVAPADGELRWSERVIPRGLRAFPVVPVRR